MWLLTINRYYDKDYELLYVYDKKKDIIADLKNHGFKWDSFNKTYEFESEHYTYWTWIEKIKKNKIDTNLII